MVTIVYKKKGFYAHFKSEYEARQYMINNGIQYHFVNIIKDNESVKNTRWYRFITVIELS